MYTAERVLALRQHHLHAKFHKNLAILLEYGKYKYGEVRVMAVLHDNIQCLFSNYE
jgi:hypothetical protein